MRIQPSNAVLHETTPVEARPRVLIVDDDAQLLVVYERILRGAGFDIERASEGKAAAEAVKREHFDVVLTDIDLPGLNGIGLLRAVREHDLDLPVVLITASPAVETAVQALECGALRYLIKPVSPADLKAAVKHAAQLRRLAALKREAVGMVAAEQFKVGDRSGLEVVFERALDALWMAFQPIVAVSTRTTFAFDGKHARRRQVAQQLERGDHSAVSVTSSVVPSPNWSDERPLLRGQMRTLAAAKPCHPHDVRMARNRSIAASRMAGLIGLAKAATAPSERPCSETARSAERITTGMSASRESDLWCWRNVRPSMIGIMRSSTIRDGSAEELRRHSSASAPLRAAATV